MRLLSTTRAVRKRLDFERPVSNDIIRACLELALQAPTGANRQGWRWIVITDRDKRNAMGEIYRRGAGTYLEDGQRKLMLLEPRKTAACFRRPNI